MRTTGTRGRSTQGSLAIAANPLLRLWEGAQRPIPPGRYGLPTVEQMVMEGSLRFEACRKYSWAIPSEKALAAIAKHSPIVEIGAGTGYWAALLQRRGVDIVAFDARPPNSTRRNGHHTNAAPFTNVRRGGPAMARRYAARSLFLCWPPYGTAMAERCLTHYEHGGGQTLIYIGEGSGGCNATYDFFRKLEVGWEEVETVHIPQWFALHDYLTIYARTPTSSVEL